MIHLSTDNCMDEEDYKNIAKIDQQLEKDPNNLNLMLEKACIYYNADNDKDVYETCMQIIKLHPESPHAYYILSAYLEKIIYETEEAEKIALEGIKHNPSHAGLHHILSICYEACKTEEEKKKHVYHLKKSVDLAPHWISNNTAWVAHLMTENKYKKARKQLDIAYQYLPKEKYDRTSIL